MMNLAKKMTNKERDADMAANHAGDEIDSGHDIDKNDPSNNATELGMNVYFKQNRVMLFGVQPHINKNIKTSFKKVLKDAPKDTEKVLNSKKSKDLLGIHKDRYQPKIENGPTVVNSNTEFCGISDRAHGYCNGAADALVKFHTLAFFDPKLPKLKTTAEYMQKMDDIFAGKATIIPGYQGLEELTKVPEFELYYKLNMMQLWKTRSVRWKMLPIFWNASKEMTVEQQSAFVMDLEKRLARNEMPKIIFSSLIPSAPIMGMNTDIHVVLANGVEKLANGNTRIMIWDINFYAKTLMKEPKYLEITPDHKIHYAPWYDPKVKYADKSDLIANVQIAPENDAEVVGMIRSLGDFCKKYPDYCK